MISTLTIRRVALVGWRLPADLYFWLKAMLLALVAVQLAALVWVIASPVGPLGEWRPSPPRLLSPEAQAAIIASVDPFFRPSPGADKAAAAAPSVDLQLFGTRASQGRVPGSAILGTAEGEQKTYLIGEEVEPGVKLAAVAFDHVVLDRDGSTQTIYMPQAEGAEQSGGAAAAATASAANAFQLTPRKQGDRVTGVLVAPSGNPQLFAASGLRDGDVIVAVNGAQITSMIDVQQLQSSIAPGARLMLTVERGADKVPVALNLPSNR